MKKTLLVLTTLSFTLLCMLSCGEEHAIKSQIQKKMDSLSNVTGADIEIKYDKFYGCVWKYDDKEDKAIIKKYGKEKYDRILEYSIDIMTNSIVHHTTNNIQAIKEQAIEIDRILKDCGIKPTSYFSVCRLEMTYPVTEQKAVGFMGIVGNSNSIGVILDEDSFRQIE